jgi:hypothetical protein
MSREGEGRLTTDGHFCEFCEWGGKVRRVLETLLNKRKVNLR